jgi:aminopeptidase N
MAQQIAVGLFPALLVEPETLELTDAYLREQAPVPPLRRLLTESRDAMARALRAQDRDRQR